MGEWISSVARQAIADGSLASGIIVAGHTYGIGAARIRLAQILLGEGATAHERITGHVAWATADGRQAAQITIGTNAAGAIACILADAIEAGRPARRAIRITITLRPALCVRTANIALGALTQRPMIGHRLAAGSDAALSAGWHTLVVAAHIPAAAVAVVLALVATAAQRIAQKAMQAGTGGHSINNLAFGVNAARARMTLFLCECVKVKGKS